MNLLIVSTSTVYGKPYLSYLKEECADFFAKAPKILFIPFARPGGMTHETYTAKAKEVFTSWGLASLRELLRLWLRSSRSRGVFWLKRKCFPHP